MGKGKAPDALQYEIIRKNERRRAYREAVQRNKRVNALKKKERSKNGTK